MAEHRTARPGQLDRTAVQRLTLDIAAVLARVRRPGGNGPTTGTCALAADEQGSYTLHHRADRRRRWAGSWGAGVVELALEPRAAAMLLTQCADQVVDLARSVRAGVQPTHPAQPAGRLLVAAGGAGDTAVAGASCSPSTGWISSWPHGWRVFRRWPSSSAAEQLRRTAVQAWPNHRDEELDTLGRSPRDAVVFALHHLGDVDLAWTLAHNLELTDTRTWTELADAYEGVDPLGLPAGVA